MNNCYFHIYKFHLDIISKLSNYACLCAIHSFLFIYLHILRPDLSNRYHQVTIYSINFDESKESGTYNSLLYISLVVHYI